MAHRHLHHVPVVAQSVTTEPPAQPIVSMSDVRAEARISEQVPIISASPPITSQIVPVPASLLDPQTVAQVDGNRTRGSDSGVTQDSPRKRKKKRKHRHHRMKNRRMRADKNQTHSRHHHHHSGRHDNKICRYRLMDRCSWPQCNRACPRLYNPLTGKQQQPVHPLLSP